jgi:hypothetical protein
VRRLPYGCGGPFSALGIPAGGGGTGREAGLLTARSAISQGRLSPEPVHPLRVPRAAVLNPVRMTSLLWIVAGVVCVGWSRWYMPRELVRIRARIAERGGSTDRIDGILGSSAFRFFMAWVGAAGVVLVIFGLVIAVE